MSLLEIDETERLSAPLSIEAFRDLTEWWWGGSHEPEMSPPLALGWDIHRQWPNAEGFAIWRDLMHEYEQPLLVNNLLGPGDPRQPVTMEQYEAALVDEWGSYAREKHWLDQLIVDVMHGERERGYEPCGDAWARTEAILNELAAKVGAKRAGDEAQRDAREARRQKRLDRYFDLDDAAYAQWLANGRPWSDAKKIERWSERRTHELLEKAKSMSVVPFPAPPKQAAPRYRFETISDLRKLPAAKWLVDKWIPDEGVGLIFGEYAGGKSFILFDLLLHLAYGLPEWHGAKLPGEPRDVLLIAREGSKGFGERIDAFKAHHGIAADPDRLVFMRSPTNLGDPAQFEELKAAIAASGRQFKVVAVDTVGRALPGEDFYDAKSITGFMERLQQLGEIGQGVAIGVHHVNKSGDAFGSVYFGASSDFMFLVEREGDGQLVRGKLTCAKMKDGEDGWKRRVDYGKAASSLVVTDVTEGGDMMGKALKLSDDDRLALQALGEALRARGQLRPEFPGRSVTLNEWLDQCFKIGGVSPVAAKPMRDLHRRQVKLLANRLILVQDQLVRIIDQTANAHAAIPMATPAGQFPPIPPRQT
ncbi:AAA family ATPase [Bradyrhizobium sp. 159]|uniref:AAA family ATPase n=1 Tax=Bradyrhizobium sp. 159 TaxID=2782632 RepID=UPI001FF7A66B|nr:AAA family ATPase [Bradyrhizobium sp. 159]MCK1619546.1 AAA family ATPase [Bradyrhizobium sp. 159]